MTRAEAAEAIGISEDRLVQHISRGALSKMPRERGVYSRADLAVVRAQLALQAALGEHSPMVAPYMAQLAPRIWNLVRDGQSRVVIARIEPTAGVRVDITVRVNADGTLSAA
jgi:hypothetical protein